jgi:DNA-binding SARP family transcriptional activator
MKPRAGLVADAHRVEQLRHPPDGGRRHVIRVLGPLLIDDGERTLGARDLGGARPKQVLEILLCARGHSVPVDRIAEAVWGDDPPQNAGGSLHTFVSVLRRHLAPSAGVARQLVVTEPEAYRFATEQVLFDLDRFDALLEESAHQPTRAARASLDRALDLVRGEVFEDEPYAAWASDLRGSYQGRILGARLDAADLALAEFDFASALAHARAAVDLDRFSERALRGEMLALYALERGHEALEHYRGFRRRLSDDLGLEPTAQTRALESAILRQEDIHPLLPRPIHATSAQPGAGSLHLLGRATEIDALSESIRRALGGSLALLQIDGEAGLGKTRVLEELQRALRGVRVGRSGASQLEAHLPYVPLATALRQALFDRQLDPQRLPALCALLPELGLNAPQRRFEEVEVLEALVAVLADHAPLVLMLDDLQWADPQTIAALGYLRRRGAGLAVAVVVSARAAEAPADHPLHRLRADEMIVLEPLTPDDLAPLAIPDLHDRTGGNPRFIEEEMADARSTQRSSTLAAALVAQCRAEGPWSYRVLLSASLLGQPFDPAALAELIDVELDPLTEELERLCERRILRVDGTRFCFRYDLIRRVLLASLSPARQRLMRERLQRGDSQPPISTVPGA